MSYDDIPFEELMRNEGLLEHVCKCGQSFHFPESFAAHIDKCKIWKASFDNKATVEAPK